jgi:hypothetical protein
MLSHNLKGNSYEDLDKIKKKLWLKLNGKIVFKIILLMLAIMFPKKEDKGKYVKNLDLA